MICCFYFFENKIVSWTGVYKRDPQNITIDFIRGLSVGGNAVEYI